MEIFRLAPGQVIFEGTNYTRKAVRDRVQQFLEEQGIHPIEAEGMLIDNTPSRVGLAWWTDERGFVQEHHEGAIPVVVVNVNDDRRAFHSSDIVRRRHGTRIDIG